MLGCMKVTKFQQKLALHKINYGDRLAKFNKYCFRKDLWVQITNAEVVEKAQSLGVSTFLLSDDVSSHEIHENNNVYKVLEAVQLPYYILYEINDCLPVIDQKINKLVGLYIFEFTEEKAQTIKQLAQDIAYQEIFVVLELEDWKIIPVENAIALLNEEHEKRIPIYPVVNSVKDATLMLNILEKGTNGVLLKTEDPQQVEDMYQYISQLKQSQQAAQLSCASITSIIEVELCDRVCVDICSMMVPGQGMLVGCFSRGLFLAHSECEESSYINSRPFRVNAGAVSCYIQCPNGRTQYLSEIKCGSEVAVYDAQGKEIKAIVGRSKIEQRPMVIIEAVVGDDSDNQDSISVVLQNAETVKLVGPDNTSGWRTIPVTQMKKGDQVFVQCITGARHTGIVIDEAIVEK